MKQAITKKAAAKATTTAAPDVAIRVLKTATCPSLSGKSTLTYEVGGESETDIRIRVSANSGGGFFAPEWVSLDTLQEALGKRPAGKPMTSSVLRKLFRGKSVNTAGFLLAVLQREGLVQPMKDKQRCYEVLDPSLFIGEIVALMPGVPAAIGEKQGDAPETSKKSKLFKKVAA